MNYKEAIKYVIERSGYDRGFVANPFDAEAVGLHRTEKLLEYLANPEKEFKSVHIAGSKGKGSTAAMIASVLRAAGLRVGLYTTPHLHTFRERIQIDGDPISEDLFAELTAGIAPLNARLASERPDWGEATAFEVSTALAFQAFARSEVEFAVVEVGLGGRLDATNVIDPEVSVIASISLDHTSILGDSIGQIASEKGGIIKPGRPVVTAQLDASAAKVIQNIASERGSRLIAGGIDWHSHGSSECFTVFSPRRERKNLEVGLFGDHQVENAGLAVTALDELMAAGTEIDEDALRNGLRTVSWPGRFERIHEKPIVIVDGAHNVDSAARLIAALNAQFPGRAIKFVLGIARDKDIPGIMQQLVPAASAVVATASRSPRAASTAQLIEAVRKVRPGVEASSSETVESALQHLLESSLPDDVICVTGSLYVVAEAREALGLAEPADFEQELLYR